MSSIKKIPNQEKEPTVTTYADLIVDYLIQLDIDYLFGIPGGAIEPLYNAIGRHLRRQEGETITTDSESIIPVRKRRDSKGIRPIVTRHEAAAAFMADGYTRETGKLGVCCATTGPGATNLITGVASAYVDRVPMLVITPQTALPDFGKMGLQESSSDAIDIVGMFEHCTRYNSLVSHPAQLEGKLYTALINAHRHPQGPVHLSIPMDILDAPITTHSKSYPVAHLFRQLETVDEGAYTALVQTIIKSKRIVLFIGGGSKNAVPHINQLADMVDAEIVTTPSGKCWISAYNPRYRGVFGFAGHQSAMECIMHKDVDLIIAVGTRLGELSTCGWNESLLLNKKLVHLSQIPEDFARSPMAGLHVLGNVGYIFKNICNDPLIKKIASRNSINSNQQLQEEQHYLPKKLTFRTVSKCSSDAAPLKPQRVMKELITIFPRETRYVADAGNTWAWVTHYLMDRDINTQRIGFGFGSMGWAIGAAVGTALGNREDLTVCITGDGSYLMSGQEITVAVSEKLPMIFIVLNDQALGMVKHGQRLGGAEQLCYQLPPVDFAMMAKAVGANGITIKTPEDFSQLNIDTVRASGKPWLLDIHIDPEEVPPIGSRIEVLNKVK